MIDAARFATLLCDWCLEPRPGDQLLITTSTLALPLIKELHRELLSREVWPLLRPEYPEQAEDFYAHAHDAQIDGFAPLELAQANAVDAVLRVDAPSNTRALASVEPERIARAARARAPIRDARMTKRWCGTLWPTPALAQQAGMSESDYSAFLARALLLDEPEPVSAWRELSARQQRLVQRLSSAREIRIEAPRTDLRLRVDGRTWINSDGRRNMPSGEVFTSPHEDSAEGTIFFSVPSSPHGLEVSGVELRFEHGEVVGATAAVGDAYLEAALATDPGARFVGELGIGTNRGIDRATGSILLDEKIAGTVHLALGRSYPETGGTNASALHWDLICDLRDGGRLTADGEVITDSGEVVE